MTEDYENEDKYEEIHIERHEEDSDDEVEIEVTEISLNEGEINYWISELESLRESRAGNISLPLDEESELMINYDDSEPEDEGTGDKKMDAVVEYEELEEGEEDDDNEEGMEDEE